MDSELAIPNQGSILVVGPTGATYEPGKCITVDLKNTVHSIVNNAMYEQDIVAKTGTPLSDNIIGFKAYYGLKNGSFIKADASSGVDFSLAGLTDKPQNLDNIRSVRVFLVARNPIKSIPIDGNCNTTVSNPTSWEGGPIVDLSVNPDWKCFHYKSIDFIVPLTNLST
jgi:hypothetical protein